MKAKRTAFTLIEVMAATAIMFLIILAVVSIATNTFSAYNSAMSTLQTTSESRSVLFPLQQDLETAIIRNDGNIWFQVEHPEPVGNIPKGGAPQIMLFSPVPDRIKRESGVSDRIPGDICAVKYQIAQRSPFENPGDLIQQIYGFYRAVIDSKATFESALPYIILESGVSAENRDPYNFWQSSSAEVLDLNGKRTGQNLNRWSTEVQNFQATNIIALSLVFFYHNNETERLEALAHEDIANSTKTAFDKAGLELQMNTYTSSVKLRAGQIIVDNNDSNPKLGTLKSINVIATLLSPEGSNILRGLQVAEGQSKVSQEKFNEIVEKHSTTYTTSVKLSN
jgi:competence protein ComGC